MNQLQQLLLELSAQTGVSGQEGAVAQYLTHHATPYGACTTTLLGSVICTLREPQAGQPHLVAVAHMDEVGFIVTHIGEEGFLRVACVGGIDRKLYAATPVDIHTTSGVVKGVFCSTPPHLQKGDEKTLPKAEELWVDVGLSHGEAVKRIALGDTLTLENTPKVLLGGRVSGKALDDRACCVALLRTAQLLEGENLSCGVSFVFSTMEEVGSQGARTALWALNPTHGVALDVSFAHSPGAKREDCGLLGKGPMIGIAPILDNQGTNRLVQLAKEQEIPYQLEVMSGPTGTDADSIATTHQGVATVLLSIPQRYMHSPAEIVDPVDVEQTAQLLAAYIRQLGAAKEA